MSPPEMIAVCTVDLDERRDSFSALLRSLPRDIQLVVTLRGPREPDNELLELMPPRHTLLRVPAASLSVARNLALREIAAWDIDDTTVIAFPDDDCTWSPTTGRDVQQQFADPSLELLLGRYRPVDDEFDERYPDEPADLTPTMVMSRCASIVMFARAATAVLLEFDEQLGSGPSTRPPKTPTSRSACWPVEALPATAPTWCASIDTRPVEIHHAASSPAS